MTNNHAIAKITWYGLLTAAFEHFFVVSQNVNVWTVLLLFFHSYFNIILEIGGK